MPLPAGQKSLLKNISFIAMGYTFIGLTG